MHNVNTAPRGVAYVTDALNLLQWRIQERGLGRPRRAEKIWGGGGGPAPPLPYLRVRMTVLPSFSKGLDPPLFFIERAIQMI